MNPILIDLILAFILILFLAHGFRRGLVASLAGLLSFFVALFGANLIARACTPVVAQWIAPSVEAVLTQRAQSSQDSPEGGSLPAPSGDPSTQGETAETPAPPQQNDPDQNQFLQLLEQLGLYESVAQPVADVISLVLSIVIVGGILRQMKAMPDKTAAQDSEGPARFRL